MADLGNGFCLFWFKGSGTMLGAEAQTMPARPGPGRLRSTTRRLMSCQTAYNHVGAPLAAGEA
jgi:hypothetical protein